MKFKVAVQTEEIGITGKECTLAVIIEGLSRKHSIFHILPEGLFLSGNVVRAKAQEITLENGKIKNKGEIKDINISELDAYLIRQNPPFNRQYLTISYFLERISKTVLVINKPGAIRNNPEKILPVEVEKFIPPTVITSDTNTVTDFLEEHKEIVLKPLYHFGGNDIHHINSSSKNLSVLIKNLKKQYGSYIVAQRYLKEVREGDKRILLIDGEIAGAYMRVPPEGQVQANIVRGGKLKETELTTRDREICMALKPFLKKEDIIICGIDVIGGYLTEINTTSPSGFDPIFQLYGYKAEKKLWDIIEKRIKDI